MTATLLGLLRERVRRTDVLAFEEILESGRHRLTWGEVDTHRRKLANGLAASGVKPGDRVALVAEPGLPFVLVDFAIVSTGAISCTPHYDLGPAQLREQLLDAEPTLVCCDLARRDTVVAALGAHAPPVMTIDPAGLDELAARGASRALDALDAVTVGADDVAVLLYTSGSSGASKGVMLTHGNLGFIADSARTTWPLDEGDVVLENGILSGAYARTADLYRMLATGHALVFDLRAKPLADKLQAVRPHYFSATPATHRALAADARRQVDPHAALRDALGGRVKYCSSATAGLDPEIARFYDAAGIPLFEGYGLTETSPVISLNTPGAWRIGSVGRPIPGVTVRIADDGEILVRGPNVMKGYWRKQAATARVIDGGGWFSTGDLGRLDSDGFVFITGRKSAIINTTTGARLHPEIVERYLEQTPLVAQACALGDDAPEVVAVLVLKPEAAGMSADAQAERLRLDVDAAQDRMEVEAPGATNAPSLTRIRHFVTTTVPFAVSDGTSTPTGKVVRAQVASRHAEALGRLDQE
jgi:long-chain acyl-CoA synthetase